MDIQMYAINLIILILLCILLCIRLLIMDSAPHLIIFKIKVDLLKIIISDLILSLCRCICKKTVNKLKINGTLLEDLEIEEENAITSDKEIAREKHQKAQVQVKQRNLNKKRAAKNTKSKKKRN